MNVKRTLFSINILRKLKKKFNKIPPRFFKNLIKVCQVVIEVNQIAGFIHKIIQLILFFFSCIAGLGRNPKGTQTLSVGQSHDNGSDCTLSKITSIRMSLRTLGFDWETQRSDRDFYIRRIFENSFLGKVLIVIVFYGCWYYFV